MNNTYHQEVFYDQGGSRSPGSQRHQPQSVHRQSSRQFDAYGQMPNPLFNPDDQPQRFETNRFDRMNTAMPTGGFGGYDISGAQTWNPTAFGGSPAFSTFGATRTMKPVTRGRTNLPSVRCLEFFRAFPLTRTQSWLDQPAPHMPNMSQLGGIGQSVLGSQALRNDSYQQDSEEDLIPTAIVIKNIPFAVKKEQLVDLMTSMSLPLPYAFNYHFDNGVFRGLAFANFTSPDETAAVIDSLNHFELHGRKLRVEYKKMLPVQERERIEREKRERRGQLEEQHRPMTTNTVLNNQQSMSSLSSHIPATSPSPRPTRQDQHRKSMHTLYFYTELTNIAEVDLNDPETLSFYTEILLFKQNNDRETLIFPSTLSATQRRTIHTLAHLLSLSHSSQGQGEQRAVHVHKDGAFNNVSPHLTQGPVMHADANRRALSRAATTDFSDARGSDPTSYGPLRGYQSSGFLGIPDSPGGFNNRENLRAAKSFADLRSYTPSPAQSSASLPPIPPHIARFPDIGLGSTANATPNLTPTASGPLGQHSSESLLVNGMGTMTIGTNIDSRDSPRRLRPMFSWDTNQSAAPAPIGSNRNANMNTYEDATNRDRNQVLPARQPRGPAPAGSQNFARGRPQNGHQTHGSGELRQQNSNVEIIVE